MKNSGTDTEGMILKYISGLTIDELTVESGGSNKNIISLESCMCGTISNLKNEATEEKLVMQYGCSKIDITGL